jgi:hypothetical protein
VTPVKRSGNDVPAKKERPAEDQKLHDCPFDGGLTSQFTSGHPVSSTSMAPQDNSCVVAKGRPMVQPDGAESARNLATLDLPPWPVNACLPRPPA